MPTISMKISKRFQRLMCISFFFSMTWDLYINICNYIWSNKNLTCLYIASPSRSCHSRLTPTTLLNSSLPYKVLTPTHWLNHVLLQVGSMPNMYFVLVSGQFCFSNLAVALKDFFQLTWCVYTSEKPSSSCHMFKQMWERELHRQHRGK